MFKPKLSNTNCTVIEFYLIHYVIYLNTYHYKMYNITPGDKLIIYVIGFYWATVFSYERHQAV